MLCLYGNSEARLRLCRKLLRHSLKLEHKNRSSSIIHTLLLRETVQVFWPYYGVAFEIEILSNSKQVGFYRVLILSRSIAVAWKI
mmetsp:Transcript_68221/g.197767  ORF Transcript_68221/g.197767 Transcript_68221/m.197767 type:complete len:85 (+) Transcript_68221:223-477(+)